MSNVSRIETLIAANRAAHNDAEQQISLAREQQSNASRIESEAKKQQAQLKEELKQLNKALCQEQVKSDLPLPEGLTPEEQRLFSLGATITRTDTVNLGTGRVFLDGQYLGPCYGTKFDKAEVLHRGPHDLEKRIAALVRIVRTAYTLSENGYKATGRNSNKYYVAIAAHTMASKFHAHLGRRVTEGEPYVTYTGKDRHSWPTSRGLIPFLTEEGAELLLQTHWEDFRVLYG